MGCTSKVNTRTPIFAQRCEGLARVARGFGANYRKNYARYFICLSDVCEGCEGFARVCVCEG